MRSGNPMGNLTRDPRAPPPALGHCVPPLLTGTHRRVAASVEVSSPSIRYTLPYITYSNWSALQQHSLRSARNQTWPFSQVFFLPVSSGRRYLTVTESIRLEMTSQTIKSNL